MSVEARTLKSLVKAAAEQVIASAPELTALDQAIGDGDHGANMKRGFEAVLGKLDAIGSQPLDEALKTIGKTLVMTVGGASGPLYGTFFMAAGDALSQKKNLPEDIDRSLRPRGRRGQRARALTGRREDDARCSVPGARNVEDRIRTAGPDRAGPRRPQAKRQRGRRRCRRPKDAPRFSARAASATSIPARARAVSSCMPSATRWRRRP